MANNGVYLNYNSLDEAINSFIKYADLLLGPIQTQKELNTHVAADGDAYGGTAAGSTEDVFDTMIKYLDRIKSRTELDGKNVTETSNTYQAIETDIQHKADSVANGESVGSTVTPISVPETVYQPPVQQPVAPVEEPKKEEPQQTGHYVKVSRMIDE